MVQDSKATTFSNHPTYLPEHQANPLANLNNIHSRSSKSSNKQKKKNFLHSPSSRRGSAVGLESQSTSGSNLENKAREPPVNLKGSEPSEATLEFGVQSQSEISSIFWLSICLIFSYLTFTLLSYYNCKNSLHTSSDNPASTITTSITTLSSYNTDRGLKQQDQHRHRHHHHLFESISSSLPTTAASSSPSLNRPGQDQAPIQSNPIYHISKLLNLTLSTSMRPSNFFPGLLSLGRRTGGDSALSQSSSQSKSFFTNSLKNDAIINVNDRFFENWIGSFALGLWENLRILAQMQSILLVGLCLLTLALLAYWTNPSESTFRSYLTDISLRQSLRQLETEESSQKIMSNRSNSPPSDSGKGFAMARSPSDDELEQQLNSDSNFVASTDHSNPSITFAHKVSLSLKTPPYVKRDGKFYTVMTVKHARKSRGGSSLSTFRNRLQRKAINSSFPGMEAKREGQVGNHQAPKEDQCLECGFRNTEVQDDEFKVHQLKNHEHVSWYLGAFGTWWLVAQGWEIDSPAEISKEERRTAKTKQTSDSLGSDPEKGSVLTHDRSSKASKMSKKVTDWSLRWKRDPHLRRKLNDYGVFEMRVLNDEDDVNGARSQNSIRSLNSDKVSSSDPESSRQNRAKSRVTKTSNLSHDSSHQTPCPSASNDRLLDFRDRTKASPSHFSDTQSFPRHLHDPQSALKESSTFHSNSNDVATTLAAAQATNADLEAQLTAVQQASSSSRSQLNAQLEALRTRKKEEDASRSEIKTKMKSLDESKRQAEATKRDAERRLKAITGIRNAIQSKIDSHRRENESLKEKIVQREKKLIEAEKESEKEDLLFSRFEAERNESRSREDAELEELQTKVALLNGKLQEHQANLEAAKALAIERQVQMQAEAAATARAQAEARVAQAQARAHAKAHAQAQMHAQTQAAQHAAALNAPGNIPPHSSSNIYPLLSGPGDFPSHPYDQGWVGGPGSQQNHMASAPINMPTNSFLSPFDLSAAREMSIPGARQRELSTSSSSGAFSPPMNSPFYTDLLPSNLFASADEDDDDLRGILPGRARSATLEEALGRFGLASSESGASEENEVGDHDNEDADSGAEDDPLGQGQMMDEPDSFSDAVADDLEGDEADHDESIADAPTSTVASPTQPHSPQESVSTPNEGQWKIDENEFAHKISTSFPTAEQEGAADTTTTTTRSRSMRRPGSKGSAGRTWWGKSRSESLTRSDASPEIERNAERRDAGQDEMQTANEENESENKRSRTFSVLPKLSLNPAAKTFKSTSKSPRLSPSQPSPSFPKGRSVAPAHRLGSGGWNRGVPSAPISDYEAVRRAFEASGFPPEDADEQGRRSWSAFDSWQANHGQQQHQHQGQTHSQGSLGGVGGKRHYFSQNASPLIGGRSHLFNGVPTSNEWGVNPRSSSDSLPYSFNKTQAAPSSIFGNPLIDGGMSHQRPNGSLSHLHSSPAMLHQQGLRTRSNLNDADNGPLTSSSWLSDDDFNPLARSSSAGDVSSTSFGTNSISNKSNASSGGNVSNGQEAARSRFAFWNRKNQSQSSQVGKDPNIDVSEELIKTKGNEGEKPRFSEYLTTANTGTAAESSSLAELPPRTPDLQTGLGSTSQEATPTGPQQSNSNVTPSKKRPSFRWSSKRDSSASVNHNADIAE